MSELELIVQALTQLKELNDDIHGALNDISKAEKSLQATANTLTAFLYAYGNAGATKV